MKLTDLSKDEAERLSEFLTKKLGLRECWHESEYDNNCSVYRCINEGCKVYTHEEPFDNPSILDASFREEVLEAWRKTENCKEWKDHWKQRGSKSVRSDCFDHVADLLTSPDLVLTIAKEMGYEGNDSK